MRNPQHPILKASIKALLRCATEYEWSLQGLGMLRLYLEPDIRLHVWSREHAVEDVSVIHTHPWHFTSTIIAGELRNIRYATHPDGQRFMQQLLQCGPGGCLKSQPEMVKLRVDVDESFSEGETYSQAATVRHASFPEDGTVTIIKRAPTGDPDHALVFWPFGRDWVSAEPRRATPDEVDQITRNALARWF